MDLPPKAPPTAPAALLLAFLVGACAPGAGSGGEAERLHALFEEAWEWRLEENPLLATRTGVEGYDHLLPAARPADFARRTEQRREFLRRLEAIDRGALGEDDRISYDIFRRQLENEIREVELDAHLIPLTVDAGFHIGFARLPDRMSFADAGDYEDYLARLRAFPGYVDDHVELLREGLRRGMTLPRVVLDGYEGTITAHVVDEPEASVFWEPFRQIPPAVPEAEAERLREDGRRAIREAVVPGYRTFLEFMTGEYVPGARTTISASELPDGEALYRHHIRVFTTLERSPDEIHRTGLREVERIRREMEAIIDEVGFRGGFDAFLEFLRTDPRFYAETPEELLKEAAWIAKRMDGKLPAFFGTLPRLPYGIEPVPDEIAPKYTGGRYIGAPAGGTRGALYWVNTYALESRPLYVLPALTLHEAVPGHHLQLALKQELTDLPDFRRFWNTSAFSEGWALYAEWLGREAGMYTTPYERFGRLTYEMWRACRLVVDTGIHAQGWSRERAMDFLASNTALSLHEVRTETDRYISWPGQALAYKLGELTIRDLRSRAEEALGEAFDVRAFHDVVLGSGSVPLPVLERQVEGWIEEGGGEE